MEKRITRESIEIYETKSPRSTHQAELDKLHAVIGKLKVENDFLRYFMKPFLFILSLNFYLFAGSFDETNSLNADHPIPHQHRPEPLSTWSY